MSVFSFVPSRKWCENCVFSFVLFTLSAFNKFIYTLLRFRFFLAPIWGASRVDCCQGRFPGSALQPLIAAHLSGPREEHGTRYWQLGTGNSRLSCAYLCQPSVGNVLSRTQTLHSTPLSVQANRQTVALCIFSSVSLLHLLHPLLRG